MPMTTTLASRLRGDTSRGARRSIRQRSHCYRRVRAFLRNKSRERERERDVECRACDGGDYFDDTLKLVFFKTSSLFRVFSSCLNVRDEDFGVPKRRDDTLREREVFCLSLFLFSN